MASRLLHRPALLRAAPAAAARLRSTAVESALSSVADGLGLPSKYGHYINGQFVEPANGQYFDNISPIDGQPFIQAARGTKADVDAAVLAANTAYRTTWSKVSVTERSNMLLKIADLLEENLERLATIECVDNGKALRETKAADIPLSIDHFRYFAGVIRAEEGAASEIDANTLSLSIQEPLRSRRSRSRPLALAASPSHRCPVTSRSRSASSARSSPGTFRSSWRPGSWRRRSRRATALSSSRRSRHRRASWR